MEINLFKTKENGVKSLKHLGELYKDYDKVLKVINTNVNNRHYLSTISLIENFRKKHFDTEMGKYLHNELYNKNESSYTAMRKIVTNKGVLKDEIIGNTKIKVSGKLVDCTLKRNIDGNLELSILNESKIFPDGTVMEKLNDEITITKFIK